MGVMRRAALVVLGLALAACSAAPTRTQNAASPSAAASASPYLDPTRGVQPASTDSTAPNTASPTASASRLPASSSALTSPAPPNLSESSLTVPSDRIQSVDLSATIGNKESENFAFSGNLFMFNVGQDIYVGGTSPGKVKQVSQIASAQPGDQVLSLAFGGGNYQFWTEGQYDQSPGRAPCAYDGALSWTLYMVPSDGIPQRTVSGVNSDERFCGAAKPIIATDGAKLAVAQEAPRDGHPQAWQITLLNMLNWTTQRTVDTDDDVTSLGVSTDNIAYTEGTYDGNQQPYSDIDTRLMLSTPDHPDPLEVARDAYDVSFSGDRLTWVNDPATSQQSDSAGNPTFMTATTSDLTPQLLGTRVSLPLRPPVSAGELVTWVDSGDVLVADPAKGTVWRLAGTGSADRANLSAGSVDGGYVIDGWLTWLTLNADASQTVKAIDLTDLFPPAPTPMPTPSPRATPIPSPSVAPPQSIMVDGTTWSRFEKSALSNINGFYDVEQTYGHFLVAAYRCGATILIGSDECARAEVLLASDDGLAWTELGTVVTEPDGAGQFYQDQIQLLAPGSREVDKTIQTGLWRSIDGGLNWDFVTDPSFTSNCAGKEVGDIYQIVSDGSQLIGIGSAIWHSSDGVSWQCMGTTPRYGIAYGHGTFVGAGSTDPYSLAEWFWHSNDGLTWTKVQRSPFNPEMPVAVAAGFVTLAGAEGPAGPPTSLLTSADGLSWQQQMYPFGAADIDRLASDGTRAVVIEHGDSYVDGQVAPGAIWVSSTDGVNWTRYQLPPRTGDDAESVAILGDRIVVTGSSYNNGNSDGAGIIWSAQIP